MRISPVVAALLAAVIVLPGCASSFEAKQRTNSPRIVTPLYEGKRIPDGSLVVAALPDTLRPGALMDDEPGFHAGLLEAFSDSLEAFSTLSEVIVSDERPATTEVPLKLTRSHTARAYSMPEGKEPLTFDGATPDFVLLVSEAATDSGYEEKNVPVGGVGLGAGLSLVAGVNMGPPAAQVEMRYLLWDNRQMRTVAYGLLYVSDAFPAEGTMDEQETAWRTIVGEAARRFVEESPFAL